MPVGLAATAAHREVATCPGTAGLCIKGGTSCTSLTVGKMCGEGEAALASGSTERDSQD